MTEATLFARARPQVIRLTETYSYKITAGGMTQVEPVGAPTGQIDVIMPYDGRDYFTRQALADVKAHLKKAGGQTQVQARIGYLGLTNYGRTDLDNRCQLGMMHNVVPLDVPIRGRGLWQEAELSQESRIYWGSWGYTPEGLEWTPLRLETFVYDEVALKEEEENLVRQYGAGAVAGYQQVANRVVEQTHFEKRLLLEFRLSLLLPARMGIGREASRPRLEQMALRWPIPVSARQMRLMVNGQEWPWVLDAERNQIEWGSIRMTPRPGRVAGSDIRRLDTPVMRLWMEQPGELYTHSTPGSPNQPGELTGHIQIVIPRLLSELQARYFGATGDEPQVTIERMTMLETELVIRVESCFERRRFSPHRRLQFPSVIPEETRLADITTWLRTQQFSFASPVDVSSPAETQDGVRRYLIRATRPEGPGELVLWVVVEGVAVETWRERRIPGRETYETVRLAGDVVITLRAEVEGSGQRLTDVLDDLQAWMKARFQHVRAVK